MNAAKRSGQSEKPGNKILKKPTFSQRLRGYFLTGILVTAPISITLYVSWVLINFIDDRVKPLIPVKYNPQTYIPFEVPGIGLVALVLGLMLVGMLAAGFFGRFMINLSERLLNRMPIVRNVYSAVKQILETVLAQQSNAFREAVLVEYPRRGLWAIAFITGTTEGEVQSLTTEETVNIFLPTTPNPTSGFLLFVPKKDLVPLNMSVEEAIKMVISGGIVTPPDRRENKIDNVTSATVYERADTLRERDAIDMNVPDEDRPGEIMKGSTGRYAAEPKPDNESA